jgi:hypothetical protein
LPIIPRSATSKDDFLDETDFIISQFHWLEGGVVAVESTYAQAVQWPVLNASLDPEHWASKAAVDVAMLQIKVLPNEVYGDIALAGPRLRGISVMVCDHYRLIPRDDHFPSVKVDTLPTFCADNDTIILTPDSLDQVAALILQVHSYESETDRQIDLKSLQADTLNILRVARKILMDRKNKEHRAYLTDRARNFKANLLGSGELKK